MEIKMEIKREGSTRIVVLIGNLAIKAPRLSEWRLFLQGLLANMNEVRWSKSGLDGFAPVLWHLPGGFALAMKRARELTDEEFLSLDFDAWRDRGDYLIPVEPKSNSLGWIDGQIVAIDYGN
jgi:hypothetical protein